MRAVVQRVTSARVTIDGACVGSCGPGLALLVAAHKDDTFAEATKLAKKVATLRIMADAEGKLNLSLLDAAATDEANVLAVSNFTVYGDASGQRRPSFVAAAPFERGRELFDAFVTALRQEGLRVSIGEFGADMLVEIANDGPVTIVLDADAPPTVAQRIRDKG